jgi:pyridoxamine 5'-phosphate oxidase
LLKSIEDDGLRFFTNYESTKGQQLSANPRAAVALHWPYLGRQIRVEGQVEKTSREVSEAYFHSRPRGSQLGAAASQQSAVIESRSDLDQQRNRLDFQFKDQPIPLPDNWGGYLLKPSLIEFWQGRLDRLHDRIVYEFDGSWDWNRRSP